MASDGDELLEWEKGGFGASEQKVQVMVRLRPLNEKEVVKNEVSVWECIDDTTILFRNGLHEQSGTPTAYKFDRVFPGVSSTREVYEQGAKDVAMSVVSGINSTIFAYGQTSSGKTYTMNGIADYTVSDIYDYIEKHDERVFVLKFSAIEIYNEVVKDLLNEENYPLKLLDDPERGTIIDKLTEVTVRDSTHLRRLLSTCEAQRRTGETPLNETSSRSHQILKISIESSSREFLRKDKSATISASVSFVDLAGSERASMAISSATRLKEGCHINRSLLALGTVIRKLSEGSQGHINYRDSKLTRILQPSLGGNARTSIVCTLSPAKSHVEQSKNTLVFATCAKEVSTKAQVNIVLSDKALVTYLQKELARLESELRSSAFSSTSCDYPELLKEKNKQITKLENEIRELTKQRKLAESRVHDLLQVIGNIQEASVQMDNYTSDNEDLMSKPPQKIPEIQMSLKNQTGNTGKQHDGLIGKNNRRVDAIYEDIQCVEIGKSNYCKISDDECEAVLQDTALLSATTAKPKVRNAKKIKGSVPNQTPNGSSLGSSDVLRQNTETDLESLSNHSPDQYVCEPEAFDPPIPSSAILEQNGTPSVMDNVHRATPVALLNNNEHWGASPPEFLEKGFTGKQIRLRPKLPPSSYNTDDAVLSRNNSPSSAGSAYTGMITNDGISSSNTSLPRLKGVQSQSPAHPMDTQQVNQPYNGTSEKELQLMTIFQQQDALDKSAWPPQFDRLQKSIFGLWKDCQVSLVHRTHFFLLFQSDPTDMVYWEVEFKRLIFLNQSFEKNRSIKDSQAIAQSSRSIRYERESLSKAMKKKFSKDEMNALFLNWGIAKHSKSRKLQLMNQLWSDPSNLDKIAESAGIVARLVRMSEHGEALRGMFQLSFKSAHPKHTLLTCNSLLGVSMCDK